MLVSAGALEDGLRQYNFADQFSCVINLFRPQKNIQFQEIRWEIQANQVEIKSGEGDRKQQVRHLSFLNISTIVSIQISYFRSGFQIS